MFNDKSDLLTPSNSAIILIDHQPQMLFGVQSADRQTVINNVHTAYDPSWGDSGYLAICSSRVST
ncbi:hypothetical protein [Brevibacillus sp. FIR094]|uniref:hypothetical protein n=1 Tax=Brevibacillus sp. FIR094 TaxID=3134809 RepID=UPI003D1F6F9B